MKRLAEAKQLPFAYAIDDTQEVARAFGAACTPDFFGFNADLELQSRPHLPRPQSAEGPWIGPRALRRDCADHSDVSRSDTAAPEHGMLDQMAALSRDLVAAGNPSVSRICKAAESQIKRTRARIATAQ